MSMKISPDTLRKVSTGASDNTINIVSEKLHLGLSIFTRGLSA